MREIYTPFISRSKQFPTCSYPARRNEVEKLWDNATEEWYLRPKHETMQQYDKLLKATLSAALSEVASLGDE